MKPRQRSGFQDFEVRDYEKRRYRHFDQRVIDRREKRILSRLLSGNPGDAAATLDVPCGYGRFVPLCRPGSDPLVVCDLSYHMVHRARENSEAGSFSALGVTGNAASLPFGPGVFRRVLCMRLFHHLHSSRQRTEVLRELARVASGPVVLSYYRMNGFHRLQRRIRRAFRRRGARIRMLTGAEFGREAGEAGLRVVESCSVLPGIHAQTIVKLDKEAPDLASAGRI